jgi:glycogen debranching enzyme
MESLKKIFSYQGREYSLFQAGLPHFDRNFTRDALYTLLLVDDSESLLEQLEFCIAIQGQQPNAYNGEEEGKIFHEYPGVDINGKGTLYDAGDTTALFLLATAKYLRQNPANTETFIQNNKFAIQSAAKYIINHIQKGLFIEDPSYSKATEYALKVTYWKDSILLNRVGGKPNYPITYTLMHAINLAGLKAAYEILKDEMYLEYIQQMKTGLDSLYSESASSYVLAKDTIGEVIAETDDFLHMLFFLDPDDISKDKIISILAKSKYLETEFGYRTNASDFCTLLDPYHSCTLWPFEQGIIHAGAVKFGLENVQNVSAKIANFLETEPEYFKLDGVDHHYQTAGCNPQLWTWATKEYFKRLQKRNL